MGLVPCLCARWLFLAWGSVWLLPAGAGCSRGVPCPGHSSGDVSGWAGAGCCRLPRHQRRSGAGETLVHRQCRCFACPGLSRAAPSPRPGVLVAARAGGVQPSLPQPCPLSPAALPWVPWSWEDMAGVGHWGRAQMGETGASCCCGGELLVPVPVAGGAWELRPHGPQTLLPGDSHGSPGLILATAGGGDEACPATGPVPPSPVPERPCVLGTWARVPTRVPPAPTAARGAPAANRCHFLQLGFYRVGGGGGLLLNRVCIFGAF